VSVGGRLVGEGADVGDEQEVRRAMRKRAESSKWKVVSGEWRVMDGECGV
jgi:hypothetical protein